MPYFVYILQCSDTSYYTGSTTNLALRLAQHESGEIPGAYTHSRRPVKLAWFDTVPTKNDAILRERQIKGWSRAKKEALVRNDWERIHRIVQEERARREGTRRSDDD